MLTKLYSKISLLLVQVLALIYQFFWLKHLKNQLSQQPSPSITRGVFIIWSILFFFDIIIFLVNYLFFHYSGNNYFPQGQGLVGIAISLLLTMLGLKIQFEDNHFFIEIIQKIILFFLVMSMIALTTNAIQYSPFLPIDKRMIAIEDFFHIHLATIIAWTANHPYFKALLWQCYDSLPYQMAVLPLILIFFGYFSEVDDYLSLLLISTAIGFTFYFFYPTTAPASIIYSPFFIPEQYATGLKFNEIHHYLNPSTSTGGLIALPSYHAIWAWFCVYLVRDYRPLFVLLLPLNSLIVVACVCLGWHYVTDLLGSLIVIFLSHRLYAYCR